MLGYRWEPPAFENNSSAWLFVADVIVVPHQTAQLSSVVVQKLGKRYNASYMYNLYMSHVVQTYIDAAFLTLFHQWPFSLTVAALLEVDQMQ